MNKKREELKRRLTAVFREVFSRESLEITEATTAHDIEEWDSLMHITLVVAMEKEFGLQLRAAEVGRLKNVCEMLDILEERATQ
ncbi:MAG: acyl carrier protein [Planctomycetes bacterium ADurb.Bin412]|jgi:acyl carrier protein|nr:MAG: acyl carrier protein [Planctomycetes bacterium ADurb.Bin412]